MKPSAVNPNQAKGEPNKHGIGIQIINDSNGTKDPSTKANHFKCCSYFANRIFSNLDFKKNKLYVNLILLKLLFILCFKTNKDGVPY